MVILNKIAELKLNYNGRIRTREKIIFEDGYAGEEILRHILDVAPRKVRCTIPPEELHIIIDIDGKLYNYGGNDISEYRDLPYVELKQLDNEISLGGNYYDVLANKDEVIYEIQHIMITRNRVEISEELSKYLIEFFKNKVMSGNNAVNSFVEFYLYKYPTNYFMQYDSSDGYFYFKKIE